MYAPASKGKKPRVVLGLNAGTSADGVDLAIVRFGAGKTARPVFIDGRERKYPGDIKALLDTVSNAPHVKIEQLIHLDQALGLFYGRAAASFIRTMKQKKIVVDAVASHGQTVRHSPARVRIGDFRVGGSLQLGSLEQIAVATGKPVVGDFRQADIALGNEGAPITVAAMEQLLADPKESRLVVNIGGIANYFYFPSRRVRRPIQAADCGPGNSLSDLLATDLFGRPYDRNGKLARSGEVSHRLLALLSAHPFFHNRTVSTGREEFGRELVDSILQFGRKFGLPPESLIATASELTVRGVVAAVTPLMKRDQGLDKLYLTGGGENNKFFKTRLTELLPGLKVNSVRQLGIPPGLTEAAAYAVMGRATLDGQPMRTVFCGGKTQKSIPVLGKITLPPVKAGV